MKAILMSIKPEWCAKILNGEKTIEIRKRFPKDFKGWVYIYCTKNGDGLVYDNDGKCLVNQKLFPYAKDCPENHRILNGKVIGRFWCDNVGIIKLNYCFTVPTIAYTTFADKYYSDSDLQVASCLSGGELTRYLGTDKKEVSFAIPISQLEIFDTPKELSEFKHYKKFSEIDYMLPIPKKETCERLVPLTRAPQSRQYIEVEE